MKHHLKLLRKRPNKKHLHFFQNSFPVFLLLLFFFSIETNFFDQHEFTKHSGQPTCIISVGKILICTNPFVQCGHLSGSREKTELRRDEWAFLRPRLQQDGVEHTLIWRTHTSTQISTSQSRQKKVQDVSYPTWSRMNALWTLSLIVPLLLVRTTTSVSLWWKTNIICCIQCSTRGASSFWHLWA